MARVFAWGGGIAAAFTIVYAVGGSGFLHLLTDETQVVEAAVEYLPWAVAVPLAGMTAFVWDGVFIGVTATKGMLVSSAVATIVFFMVYFVWRSQLGNHALWMAFVIYLLVRGGVQTTIYLRRMR